MLDEVEKAARGQATDPIDGRSIQPYLTYKLASILNAGLVIEAREGVVEIIAS